MRELGNDGSKTEGEKGAAPGSGWKKKFVFDQGRGVLLSCFFFLGTVVDVELFSSTAVASPYPPSQSADSSGIALVYSSSPCPSP